MYHVHSSKHSRRIIRVTNITQEVKGDRLGWERDTMCKWLRVVDAGVNEIVESGGRFRCEVKIISKFEDIILECSPKETFKKQSNAIQNASLKVLLWLNAYFGDPTVPLERLNASADGRNIRFDSQTFIKTFMLCQHIHNVGHKETEDGKLAYSNSVNASFILSGIELRSLSIEGPDSGVFPSIGSLACASYSVSLVTEGKHMKELLESSDDFEFEIASGAVIPHLESVITQMTVGQSAFFSMDLPPQELVFAAAGNSEKSLLHSILQWFGYLREMIFLCCRFRTS